MAGWERSRHHRDMPPAAAVCPQSHTHSNNCHKHKHTSLLTASMLYRILKIILQENNCTCTYCCRKHWMRPWISFDAKWLPWISYTDTSSQKLHINTPQVNITLQTFGLPCKEGCLCVFPRQSRLEVEAHDRPTEITHIQFTRATASDHILTIDYKYKDCFSKITCTA